MRVPRGTRTASQRLLELGRSRGLLRGADAKAVGATRATISRLVAAGELTRVGRGIYSVTGAELSAHLSLVMAQQRVPKGTICLMSALQFHELTTQAPRAVWVMVSGHAWRPSIDYPPVRLVHATGRGLSYGIETHELDGWKIRMTSAAKTVADCFKFRRTVGLDVALEALRNYKRSRGDMDALWRAAKVDRVQRVLRPYLEAVT